MCSRLHTYSYLFDSTKTQEPATHLNIQNSQELPT